MDVNKFAQDRKIDPSQLDLEAARQADLFFDWAEKSIKARGEVDRAKLKMDVTEARLQMQCRRKPQDFGLEKVTESAIVAAVKTCEEYLETYEDFLTARQTSAILDKAVDAMEQRKRMIEVLVTLHGQKYFAGPSVPRDLVTAWNEDQANRSQSLNKKQVARSRKRRSKK